MAPEILKRDYYKMPADIYSFAVTMLEIMIWDEAFPKEEFTFAWDIADAVSNGKRPIRISNVKDERIREIIEESWKEEPKERLSIDEIVKKLEMITNGTNI